MSWQQQQQTGGTIPDVCPLLTTTTNQRGATPRHDRHPAAAG